MKLILAHNPSRSELKYFVKEFTSKYLSRTCKHLLLLRKFENLDNLDLPMVETIREETSFLKESLNEYLYCLTVIERKVILLTLTGKKDLPIADEIGISEEYVMMFRKSAITKLRTEIAKNTEEK